MTSIKAPSLPAVVKIVFVGAEGCGKTMLCGRMLGKKDAGGKTTVGFNVIEKEIEGVRMQFWDTAGKLKFRTPEITKSTYYNADVAVIVVNITLTKKVVEEHIRSWFDEIRYFSNSATVFVALNFCNVPDQRDCTSLVADISSNFQSDNISFVPVCSSEGTGTSCLLRDLRTAGVKRALKTTAERQKRFSTTSNDDSHLRRMHGSSKQRSSLFGKQGHEISPKTDKLDNVVKSFRDTFRSIGKKLPFSF